MVLDYQYFKIYFTIFLLWLGFQFPGIVTDFIAYFLILTLGVIHGANDLLVLKKYEKRRNSYIKSVIGYIGLICICVSSFFLNPFISLLLFIIVSGYHFGEQHFENKIIAPKIYSYSVYLVYGLLIFGMIFLENRTEVDSIVNRLAKKSFPENSVFIGTIACSIILIFLLILGILKNFKLKFNIYKEIFYVGLLYLVFRNTGLIFGFGVYFIFWHSIPSIIDQTKYLSGAADKKNLLYYFKSASPYWLLSIGGLLGLYSLMDEGYLTPAVFLILFAVTAPHVWVIFRMKKTIE